MSNLSHSRAWDVATCSLKITCLFLPLVCFLWCELVLSLLFEDVAINKRLDPVLKELII